jgi:hypothetical protein
VQKLGGELGDVAVAALNEIQDVKHDLLELRERYEESGRQV